ncbi:MAG: DUF4249 domain-containing protein [Paludibacter sp.]|nr:DUF4249 domain-containing protein [Paludibacter sp.]
MKTKLYFLPTFIISIFLTTSCISEIEFDGDVQESLLVMNGFINPDSLIKVHLSKSKFFLQSDSDFPVVADATVTLFVNDQEKGILNYTSNGYYYYQSTYIPQVGDKIKITASNSQFSTIESTTEIPSNPNILSVDTLNFKTNMDYIINYDYYNENSEPVKDTVGLYISEEGDLRIKFKDNIKLTNYYRIKTAVKNYFDNDSTAIIYTNGYSDDMVFGGNEIEDIWDVSSYSQYNEFNDELFNGKEYTLKYHYSLYESIYTKKTDVETNYYDYSNPYYKTETKIPVKRELLVILQSISKDYYYYLKTRSASENEMEFFSEPVQVYSNISNKIGIIGSFSTSTYSISLP